MSKLTRRRFVKTTFAEGLAASILPTDRVLGANSDIRVAVVGFNSRGQGLISGFQSLPGVRVAALCDVDSAILNRVADDLDKNTKTKTQRYTDIRKLLADKNIDAVAFATPIHWNGYAALLALEAGKDVYVEKPVCHTLQTVRSRKHADLNADIAEGRLSTAMCQLANISYKLGHPAAPDDNCYTKQIEAAKTNPYFASRWESIKAHLKINKVDVTKTPMLIGAPLQLDSKKEAFTGPAEIAKKATALITKEYRKPFTLPG